MTKVVRQQMVEHLGSVTKVPQGKAVVEEQPNGSFMVMMPDGDVQMAVTKKDVERRVRAWFKRDLERLTRTTRGVGPRVGIGTIEWRLL